jgi:hypothetical protein
MYEYVAFNPYNSSPEALAAELTKKSAEGWEVVNVVPTFDGRYCAFLRRPTSEIGTTTSTYTSTTAPFQTATQVAATSSAAPASWYPDPSKRFELRYWDGAEWTEHVARGGQQFTDQPVA